MPATQFKILSTNYLPGETSNRLIIEIGDHHLSCAVSNEGHSQVVAFEMFTFDAEEASDLEATFSTIKTQSQILSNAFSSVDIVVNNGLSVLVPAYKFNKEISDDYLRLALGDGGAHLKVFDKLECDPAIVNVYRLPINWNDVLLKHYEIRSASHIYTKIVQAALDTNKANETIYIQFYHSHFIVCALRQQVLLFIQSFSYDAPEDVVYMLLNITQQLELARPLVRVSGMIELQSNLYREMQKYFSNIEVEVLGEGQAIEQEQHPAHYFTPFSKLVS
ncbi:DUF3822 family protein [Aridibaculum aurantiacum]|uniref:DUF3822 family protein n=1 Tax=Aridibaculum aurantiacum TaxID=2810307 RepID=UPI001A9739B0|nr:DUF3822 family protein [Aridibaculum aurantiacum]